MKRLLFAAAAALFVCSGVSPAKSDPFLGEIRTFAFNFCPRGNAPLNGAILPINQNQALFSLLGWTYGGNFVSTFALPTAEPIITATGAPLLQCIALQGIYPPRE